MRSLDGALHLADGAGALVDVDAGGGVRRQHCAGGPPADVAADLHAVEVDHRHAAVGVLAGLRQGVAQTGDGQHPAAGDTATVGACQEGDRLRIVMTETGDGLADDWLGGVARRGGGHHRARGAVANRQ